ncbi:hypothetical protein, partial [Intestinimonas timonensis]|uniref:hypothetical protein n=1 Tax=Intestinimonas timonensis TaxID=1689270 RepID=UPI003A943772
MILRIFYFQVYIAICAGVKRPAKGEKAKSPKSLIYWAFRGFLPKGANSEKFGGKGQNLRTLKDN